MQGLKKLLVDLQLGIFVVFSKHEPIQSAKQSNSIRFLSMLFLYYFSLWLLATGLLLKKNELVHLHYGFGLTAVLAVPYAAYKLVLEALLVHPLEIGQDETQNARNARLYYYGLAGGFGLFAGVIVLICLRYSP